MYWTVNAMFVVVNGGEWNAASLVSQKNKSNYSSSTRREQ
jgi:hypothetical protein